MQYLNPGPGRGSFFAPAPACPLTFFFRMIPGFSQTSTRLRVVSPLASGPDDPGLQKVVGIVFLLFLGAITQVLRIRKEGRAAP